MHVEFVGRNKILVIEDSNDSNIERCVIWHHNCGIFVLDFRFLGNSKKPKYCDIDCSQNLRSIIQKYPSFVSSCIDTSETPIQMCIQIVSILDGVLLDKSSSISLGHHDSNVIAFNEHLFKELCVVGWNRIQSITHSLTHTSVHLSIPFIDSSNRIHSIEMDVEPSLTHSSTISLTAQYVPSFKPPIFSVESLPVQYCVVEERWDESMSLADAIHECEDYINAYVPLWKELEEIDSFCTVLDPIKPSLNVVYRRILISSVCSLFVSLTMGPTVQLSEWRVMGHEKYSSEFSRKIRENMSKWNMSLSIRKNFEQILSLEFPKIMGNSQNHDSQLECCICYSFELVVGETKHFPDKVCDCVACSRSFHSFCLMEYFSSDPTCKKVFNTFLGLCPYCKSSLSLDFSNVHR